MSIDHNQLPEPASPRPPEVEAERVGTALEALASPPAEPAPPGAGSRSPGLVLLAIFAAVLAVAGVTWFSRARPPAPEAQTPAAPAPLSIRLPATQAPPGGGAHDAPGPANPSPDKIFNDAASFKEPTGKEQIGEDLAGEDLAGEAPPPAAQPNGFITDLPPAPHAAPDGTANETLRDGAKNALKNQTPIAPQADEPEAALWSPDARADLESQSRRALAFAALAAKARAGAPYTDDLRRYLAERQDRPLPAVVADLAAAGAPTPAALAISFGADQRAALAAGRRAEASGPAASLGASFASLIDLRPARPQEGAATAAVLSRAEAALAAHDLPAALSALAALRPEALAPLAGWIRRAQARLALEAALDEREKALFAALNDGRR